MENIKVTVYLSTYNQEPYLREAIDSILMQKCDFRYELLIADDCSTDGTQAIALEYQKKYPDIITTYFTPVNVGGCKKLTNCIDMGLFRGEYLAYLEGDDYWLGENRLQVLVDFLEANPEYSRVSHRRRVIDENGKDKGCDIRDDVVGKAFTIGDFLAGKNYSDFGSVFRNYFQEAGDKYHSLLCASRNVCDFQDMFITQDFGPVYVMDEYFGVYRSRSVAGATNYNSITSQSARCRDNIRIARAVEEFYGGKYDLSPMILHNQKRLVLQAAEAGDAQMLAQAREFVPVEAMRRIAPELVYLAQRGNRKSEIAFLRTELTGQERRGLGFRTAAYAGKRLINKLGGKRPNTKLRGYVREGRQK